MYVSRGKTHLNVSHSLKEKAWHLNVFLIQTYKRIVFTQKELAEYPMYSASPFGELIRLRK